MKPIRFKAWRLVPLLAVLALATVMGLRAAPTDTHNAQAATGDLVASLNFDQPCSTNLGVGIAFDGTNLWYSCNGDSPNLHRADPTTGIVNASYTVPISSIGAISYDATRNVIWAAGDADAVYRIDLDAGMNVVSSALAFNTGDSCGLNDGLAFDARNIADPNDDVFYYSDDCFTTVIVAYDMAGSPVESFDTCATGGHNSGLAVGGELLFQADLFNNSTCVVDKTSKALQFTYSTAVAGDPNFHAEDMECDNSTFPVDVMWSIEAFEPRRAHAFEIPDGTCGAGGVPEDQGCPESPIAPSTVVAVLFPGQSQEVEKCVEVPDLPPKPDIMILFDTTGSMGDDIATVQAKLGDLISAVNAGTTDPQFGVAKYEDFPFSPWGLNSNVAYELLQSITGDTVAVTNAINALSTFPGSGSDTPESGYEALYQTLTGAGRNLLDAGGAGPDGDFTDLGEIAPGQDAGFRADSSRVILLVGDAAFHDAGDAPASAQFPAGYPGASEADVLAAMGDTSLFCLIPDELEGVGPESQCDDLGGTNIPIGASSADIVEAIIQALGEVEVEVEMVSDCAWPISTTFAPASQTVAAGGVALFTETISVAADSPGGTYICTDRVLIDGDLLLDEAGNIATEIKVVRVPEGFLTGGGQIVNGKGKTSSEQISFGGNVGFLEDGSLVGHWETNFQNVHDVKLTGSTSNFHSTEIVALQFANDGGAGPNPPPANANIGAFLATGRLGQEDGWSLLVCLADRGEPGKHDSIRLKLFTPGGVLLYDSLSDYASEDDTLGGVCEDRHKLDHGNFQIHSGLKD